MQSQPLDAPAGALVDYLPPLTMQSRPLDQLHPPSPGMMSIVLIRMLLDADAGGAKKKKKGVRKGNQELDLDRPTDREM